MADPDAFDLTSTPNLVDRPCPGLVGKRAVGGIQLEDNVEALDSARRSAPYCSKQ